MSKMRTLHKRRKRRTLKQGRGKSVHKGLSGRTGGMHSKKLRSRRASTSAVIQPQAQPAALSPETDQ